MRRIVLAIAIVLVTIIVMTVTLVEQAPEAPTDCGLSPASACKYLKQLP